MKGRKSQEPLSWDQDILEEPTNDLDIHTSSTPYCDNPTCWCHSTVAYHDEVPHPTVSDEEITQEYTFLGLSR